jgi:hypothetical protein
MPGSLMLSVLPDNDSSCSLYSCSFMETARNLGTIESTLYLFITINSQRDEKLNSSRNDAAARTFLLHKAFVLSYNSKCRLRHSTLVLDALLEQGQFLVHLAPDLLDLVVRIHDMIFDRYRLLFLSEPLQDLPQARQLKAAKGYALFDTE